MSAEPPQGGWGLSVAVGPVPGLVTERPHHLHEVPWRHREHAVRDEHITPTRYCLIRRNGRRQAGSRRRKAARSAAVTVTKIRPANGCSLTLCTSSQRTKPAAASVA